MSNWRRRTAIVAAASTAAVVSPALTRAAAADIQGFDWATTAATLHSGASSNEVGFWQSILYSNVTCPLTNNGVFGSQTLGYTKGWQSGVLGYTGSAVDGVVGVHTWHDTQYAQGPGGGRLQSLGGGFWSYYGGGPDTSDLYKQTSGAQKWKFRQMNPQHNGPWYIATTSKTETPFSC